MSTKRAQIHTQSGRTLDELTMEAVLEGQLTEADFRISDETLRRQADDAEAAGYPELALSLRRAAELTRISNQEVLDIYTTLRPGRTSYAQLIALAERLEDELDAPLNGALVREAADAYLAQGLIEEPKAHPDDSES